VTAFRSRSSSRARASRNPGKEAKRLIADGGARMNDRAITDAGQMLAVADMAEPVKLSAGKKRHALVVLAP
jgi:tyrosyl-tRNA synthetase